MIKEILRYLAAPSLRQRYLGRTMLAFRNTRTVAAVVPDAGARLYGFVSRSLTRPQSFHPASIGIG
jgi:hypothetical protein